jgi:hypothetical protein
MQHLLEPYHVRLAISTWWIPVGRIPVIVLENIRQLGICSVRSTNTKQPSGLESQSRLQRHSAPDHHGVNSASVSSRLSIDSFGPARGRDCTLNCYSRTIDGASPLLIINLLIEESEPEAKTHLQLVVTNVWWSAMPHAG